MYSGRQVRANSADLDQTPQNVASDQGLQLFCTYPTSKASQTGNKKELFKYGKEMRWHSLIVYVLMACIACSVYLPYRSAEVKRLSLSLYFIVQTPNSYYSL